MGESYAEKTGMCCSTMISLLRELFQAMDHVRKRRVKKQLMFGMVSFKYRN